MRCELRQVADLSADEQSALRSLSLAVYPPEVAAAWLGRAIEWAPHQWGVIGWDADGAALCYVGGYSQGGPVERPSREGRRHRRREDAPGLTRTRIRYHGYAAGLDFFRGQSDVDFGLLVCEPGLVPFYQRLGWRMYPGDLLVTQHQATVPFTFNLPMTTPLRLQESLGGKIDLLGSPW